jgi:hypothetical protein
MSAGRKKTKHRAVPARKSRRQVYVPTPPDGQVRPVSSAADAVGLVRQVIDEDLGRVRQGKGLDGRALSPTQHRLLRGQLVGFVERLGKLTGETLQIPESKLVRLPAFQRLAEVIKRALEPWPPAMVAVAEALRRAETGEQQES